MPDYYQRLLQLHMGDVTYLSETGTLMTFDTDKKELVPYVKTLEIRCKEKKFSPSLIDEIAKKKQSLEKYLIESSGIEDGAAQPWMLWHGSQLLKAENGTLEYKPLPLKGP